MASEGAKGRGRARFLAAVSDVNCIRAQKKLISGYHQEAFLDSSSVIKSFASALAKDKIACHQFFNDKVQTAKQSRLKATFRANKSL
jgi:hypothetical protein